MKLWRMTYTLDDKVSAHRWQSGVWSTTEPTSKVAQRFWNKIHPEWYTVQDFTVERAPKDWDGIAHILEIVYK